MREFKGTPGPWQLSGHSCTYGRYEYGISGNTGHRVIINSATIEKAEPTIFQVCSKESYGHLGAMENGELINVSEINHLANAQLIVAAPDLLEALQSLMFHYETRGQLLSWDVNIARTAIAKALGGEVKDA